MIADYIKLRPDRIGWTLLIYTEETVHEFTVGDVIQFYEEVERTLGKWLADGPADFHGAADDRFAEARALGTMLGRLASGDPDLARDIERGK
jgi:hypothetical protein